MGKRIRRTVIGLLGLSGLAAGIGYFIQYKAAKSQQAVHALQQLENPIVVRPRASWGAVAPVFDNFEEHGRYDALTNRGGYRVYDQPLDQVLRTVVVHHSALPQSDGPREIQRMHLKDKGYADIGYHYVIDDGGAIYEGRPINVRGAHTGGFNTGSVGICLMGNFERIAPSPTQLNALQMLAGLLRDAYAVTHLAGHRDFQPGVTVCPGDQLHRQLQGIATHLDLVFGTQGYSG